METHVSCVSAFIHAASHSLATISSLHPSQAHYGPVNPLLSIHYGLFSFKGCLISCLDNNQRWLNRALFAHSDQYSCWLSLYCTWRCSYWSRFIVHSTRGACSSVDSSALRDDWRCTSISAIIQWFNALQAHLFAPIVTTVGMAWVLYNGSIRDAEPSQMVTDCI